MPGGEDNLNKSPLLELLGLQKPPTINTKPGAPGLPRYDTPGLGILPADPLMGGRSQATPVPIMTLPLVKQEAEELLRKFKAKGLWK